MSRVPADHPSALYLAESWISDDDDGESVEEYFTTLAEAQEAFAKAVRSGRFVYCGVFRWIDNREGWGAVDEWPEEAGDE